MCTYFSPNLIHLSILERESIRHNNFYLKNHPHSLPKTIWMYTIEIKVYSFTWQMLFLNLTSALILMFISVTQHHMCTQWTIPQRLRGVDLFLNPENGKLNFLMWEGYHLGFFKACIKKKENSFAIWTKCKVFENKNNLK